MAKQLEWVYTSRGFWTAGKWEIWVDADGRFYVSGIKNNGGFASLDGAKKCCQVREDAAAPVAQLPPVGSVWGVPGKSETQRRVDLVDDNVALVDFSTFHPDKSIGSAEWHAWIRESGAVLIDGNQTAENWRKIAGDLKDVLDAERKQVGELRERLAAELEATKAKLAAVEKMYAGAEDAVTTHFEVSVTAAKERDELRAANGRLMAALRGIEEHDACKHGSRFRCFDWMKQFAREAGLREEGGGKPLQSLRDAGGAGWDAIDDPAMFLERQPTQPLSQSPSPGQSPPG